MKFNHEKEFDFFKENSSKQNKKLINKKILYSSFCLCTLFLSINIIQPFNNNKVKNLAIEETTLTITPADIKKLISLNELSVDNNFIIHDLNSSKNNNFSNYRVIISTPSNNLFTVEKIEFKNNELHYFVKSQTVNEYQKFNTKTQKFESINTKFNYQKFNMKTKKFELINIAFNFTYYHIVKQKNKNSFIQSIQSLE